MPGKVKAPTSLGGASKASSQRDPDVPAAVASLDNHVFFEKHPQASQVLREEFDILRLLNGVLAALSLTAAVRAGARACGANMTGYECRRPLYFLVPYLVYH